MTTKIPVELSSTPGIVDGSNATAITIDSSENVGIGETSPLGKIHAKVSDTSASASAQGNLLVLEDTENGLSILSGTSGAGYINFGDSDDNDIGMIIYDHSVNAMRFWANAAERMRIDSSGNIGIGATPSAVGNYKVLQVRGGSTSNGGLIRLETSDGTSGVARLYAGSTSTVLESNSNTNLVFQTNATERMRINSSGQVFIGSTASVDAGFLVVKADASTYNHIVTQPTATASYNALAMVSGGGTRIGAISVGTSTNSITYGGTSDYRLKENIVPMEKGLERVKKLKPVKFDWKESGVSSEGFIAHEIQEAGWEVGVEGKKDGEEMQMVEYGKLTPLLVKAIQEQQEQIEALQSEINTLKGGD